VTKVVGALFPVFAVILIGYGLRRARFVDDAFWPAAERITFFVFFPALLVSNTARANLSGLQAGAMALALLGAIATAVAVAVAARRLLALDGPGFTSLVQSAIRPNVYVAIAAAVALFGNEGLTAISVCIAVVVPTVNIVSVFVLVRYAAGDGETDSGAAAWRKVAVRVGTNPLILACALGLALNLAGVGLPPLVGPLLEILGRASLPVGLLAVGAGLDLPALRRAGGGVAASSVLKLIALPLVTWLLVLVLDIRGTGGSVAVLMASVPVSASAYVMARQMGGDAALMAGSITATTLAAALTMPMILLLAG
jgi:malonate transporter